MDQEKQWKLSTMMIIAMVTWGLSWTNAKILGIYADPPLVMFWRFVIASTCFFFIKIVTGPFVRIPTKAASIPTPFPLRYANSIIASLE